jgi:hypothetical protein
MFFFRLVEHSLISESSKVVVLPLLETFSYFNLPFKASDSRVAISLSQQVSSLSIVTLFYATILFCTSVVKVLLMDALPII